MANYKLILEEDFNTDFSLLAIHCSADAYKMAYLLNRYLGLKLHRRRTDLDFSKQGLEISFPWFEFEDEQEYTTYDLLSNKFRTVGARTVASGGLFGEEDSEEMVTENLIPELRNVDYFLKISSDSLQLPLRKMAQSINEINEVISVYTVEIDQLKSKHNLIFD
ncbi:IPExxxVDY family protein [Aureitalea sp. L0-47]|uniref:IPExxxVDY family protein n=1 Tax=Aureitalea sp. L0-47 TaxID=2816962 RepID=UPI0022377756|nr:IPExxxVDY family protein [Aureitalea sp. L0-47]MCW5520927.1 IPExxxVDY family protein [Aureitalea sp. L0-47]